jgi:hypothetical protein
MNEGGTSRRGHMDSVIDSAPKPGCLISWSQGVAYVSGLRHVEREVPFCARRK